MAFSEYINFNSGNPIKNQQTIISTSVWIWFNFLSMYIWKNIFAKDSFSAWLLEIFTLMCQNILTLMKVTWSLFCLLRLQACCPRILAYQSTLSQSGGGGRLCPPNNTGPPGFSDLPPALGLCSKVGHRTYFTAPYMKNMLCTKIVLNVKTKTTICVHNMFSRYSELTIFMNNLSSYCGIVDAKIRASDKDLPVPCLITLIPII